MPLSDREPKHGYKHYDQVEYSAYSFCLLQLLVLLHKGRELRDEHGPKGSKPNSHENCAYHEKGIVVIGDEHQKGAKDGYGEAPLHYPFGDF